MDIGDDLDGFRHSPVGRWVGCSWNFEAGQGEPHPDDREVIAKRCPYGVSAKCVATDASYLTLDVHNHLVRVRPFAIRIRRIEPTFVPGDVVKTRVGQRGDRLVKTERVAPVRAVNWHVRRDAWIYFLRAEGQRSHRWYIAEELERVSAGPTAAA